MVLPGDAKLVAVVRGSSLGTGGLDNIVSSSSAAPSMLALKKSICVSVDSRFFDFLRVFRAGGRMLED